MTWPHTLLVLLALTLCGCAPVLTLDSARALEPGQYGALVAAEAGWTPQPPRLRYGPLTHPEWPEWRNDDVPESYPADALHISMVMRLLIGLGAGFETQLQAVLAPYAAGAGLGLKWQAVRFGDAREGMRGLFALLARGGYHFIGADEGDFGTSQHLLWAEGGLLATLELDRSYALTLSPKARFEHLIVEHWANDATASDTTGAWSAGLGLGFEAAVKRGGMRLVLELGALYTPPQQNTPPAGSWLPVIGLGVRPKPVRR